MFILFTLQYSVVATVEQVQCELFRELISTSGIGYIILFNEILMY